MLKAAIEECSKSENEKSILKFSTTDLVVITKLVDVLNLLKAAMSQVERDSTVTISDLCAAVSGFKKSFVMRILKVYICQVFLVFCVIKLTRSQILILNKSIFDSQRLYTLDLKPTD